MDTLDKILELITKRGLSDSKFAELAGLNKAVLFDWRSGKTKSYMKHLPKIAKVLDTDIDYLLNDKKAAPQEQPLSEKQETVLKLSEQLTDEDLKKLIDYAELLRKAKNQ